MYESTFMKKISEMQPAHRIKPNSGFMSSQQLVKLRKSSLVMILPDIRKCSKSDQNLVANRYSCFWSLGAIWQPLWLKNSHNVAIFSHFLTFSVTFLGAMTTFMHKTSAERTKTFLIHRTIDEVPFFAISRHLSRRPGVQKIAILWLNQDQHSGVAPG